MRNQDNVQFDAVEIDEQVSMRLKNKKKIKTRKSHTLDRSFALIK